jgi:hypothetical protein
VAAPLSDLEIAMLEMIEFGVDQFGSTASRTLAEQLIARGFIESAGESEVSGVMTTRYCLTEIGARALVAARRQLGGARAS